ncbi:hypothetical protein N0V83_000219 [Neocucurbitaria cava]|uniref:Uncharacterized protein n=1 Tax=Neocucurbitaria cava TaxID=798079 RepID=A0A9W9CRX1_9PLEO|nr:hypothetical protein N0V83_000219 [Neocucurbitaria cava]
MSSTSAMSSITPPSYVDDGVSFAKRIPHRLDSKHISRWIDSTDSSTSAYTGSFIDDGADMLPPAHDTPGFGPINKRFYKPRKKKEDKDDVWNEDMQKAISGDMARNLAKIKDLGKMEVVKRRRGDRANEKKKPVTMFLPPKWGPFVIREENGRVTVIDEDGEFDSGPLEDAEKERTEGMRWIRVTSSTEPTSVTSSTEVSTLLSSSLSTQSIYSHDAKAPRPREKDKKHSRRSQSHKRKKAHHHRHPPTPLTTMLESDYEDGYQLSGGEDNVMSPTQFFMTGGASGWPSSRTSTSVAAPAAKATTPYGSSNHDSPVKSRSPVCSPPGGWPSSPLPSPVKSVVVSEQSWGGGNDNRNAWGEDDSQPKERSERSSSSYRSERSNTSRTSRRGQGFENTSTRTYSVYRAPTVQDASETSSEGMMRRYVQTGWGGSLKSGSGKQAVRNRKDQNTDYSAGSSHAGSEQDLGGNDERSGTGWDGYERVKTVSEVSVVGTGSLRSSRESHSQAPSRQTATACSHSSRPASHAHSDLGSQMGWGGGSRASRQSWSSEKARVDDDGWGGSQQKSSEGGRANSSSKRGSEKASRYANAYDEDNETYLNENWGGTPVRVGSRQTRVAGWD